MVSTIPIQSQAPTKHKTIQDLTVSQVAKIAGCHRNTVFNYERSGYIKPVRDCNNFRRYSMEQALDLKKLFESRNAVPRTEDIK